jgi:hypothetical protein
MISHGLRVGHRNRVCLVNGDSRVCSVSVSLGSRPTSRSFLVKRMGQVMRELTNQLGAR